MSSSPPATVKCRGEAPAGPGPGPGVRAEPGQAGGQVIGGGMQRLAGHRIEGVED